MLITAYPNSIAATIRSRCQQIVFKTQTNALAIKWLNQQIPTTQNPALLLTLAEGAPLKALHYAEENFLTEQKKFLQHIWQLISGELEAVKCAASYADKTMNAVLMNLSLLLLDIIRIKLTPDLQFLYLPDEKILLEKISQKISIERLFQLQDEITAIKQLLNKHINLNQQLVLEKLFLQTGMKRS